MQMLMSWLKAWSMKLGGRKSENQAENRPLSPQKKAKYNAAFYDNFYSLIASGARLKLVEAMFSLNLFSLFEDKECVLEREILDKLALMPVRAKKWLHLLCSEHFLIKVKQGTQQAYKLPEEFIQLMQGDKWEHMQFFFNTWMVAADENLTDVLRFGKAKISVSWPPKTDGEVVWLENWMTNSAAPYIQCILEQINLKKINSLLDVGGGDGTMACAFASTHSHLEATVYNLPKSAEMARNTIASRGLSQRVHVIEGDFITEDAFPVGFDLILFNRVLLDWDEGVNRKLLRMAYLALPKNGLVAICEFFQEESHDRCLAGEYRYIFHDDFASNLMKPAATYRRMLEEIGFTMLPTEKPQKPFSFCSLLLAQK